MQHVVIKRCPFCPSIRSHTDGMVRALEADFNLRPDVQDGAKDELSVWVGGAVVVRRNGDDLPSVHEVEAAVRNVTPAVV